MPIEWQPIETAPRDGTIIRITAFEDDGTIFEIHPMQWCHIQRNEFFAPGEVGMWTAPDGSYTWREGEGGPTHWAELASLDECAHFPHTIPVNKREQTSINENENG